MGRPKKPKAPEIYSYHDYRQFLRDWLDFAKTTRRKITLRTIAATTGVSPSYLSMILSGARNFSETSLRQFLPILELTGAEEEYLFLLRTISDSESQAERTQALNKLQKFTAYRNVYPKELEVYRYLSNWYYVAIREMAALSEFRLDLQWIQKRLVYPVTLQEVAKAVEFLLAHGYIEELPDGRAKLPQKQIDCMGGVYKIALAKFHREMFDLASQSIDVTPREKRNLTFHTFAMSENNFERLRELLDQTHAALVGFGEREKDSDCVYHVTLACFPLSQR
jgi:uncharacterized protein (TIGR02147 family)